MSWTEIWITYLQPIVTFVLGSGIVGIISKALANNTLNKLYNKKNLEAMSKKVVDNVVAQPVKIQIEDKIDKHLDKINKANEKQINELKLCIKAYNKVFKGIAELFDDSYAISQDKKDTLKNAINEIDKMDVETADNKEIVVKLEQKEQVETTKATAIKR